MKNMKISVSKVLNIVLVSLLVTVLFFGVATSNSGDGYDPWVDYDESGNVDHMDLYQFAQSYGESGDPTKNVTIKRNYYTYHKSFTDVAPGSWNGIGNSTAGYDRVSLFMVIFQMNATIDVFFGIEGSGPFLVDEFSVYGWDEWSTCIHRVYDVDGDRIVVNIKNIGTSIGEEYIGMYVTA